ncbi:MAG TPA: acetamidase/formamidase family protein [Bryobacteraceae bacterium]|jgi:amidase|nr:acetamidase/formamidase family protein [Bryobacteraceae bacterium]
MNRILASLLLAAATTLAADVSGDWEFTAKTLGDAFYARVTLKTEGNKLTGNLNELKLEGTLAGDKLNFEAKRPNGDAFGTFEGAIHGAEISGTALLHKTDKVEWVARRPAAAPASPRTLDFEPKEFHRLFSDAIPPVLRLFPGDTVRTWTVDAGGVDPKGVHRSQGGNPETGPFYIEGAFPGDTLIIKLNKVRLNRDSAESGDRTVGSALNPGYIQDTKYKDNFDSSWIIDQAKGVARLKNPSEHLKNYTVKLQPMMGCIAVAPPAHQAMRTGFLGSYGGNMDYNQMREGTTLYLPVYAPGALLFIGDGHAAQGDGELTGDALETSMQVEFTVNLIKGEAMGGPRAENDEYLMSLGIGNSLDDALRGATTRLTNWLQKDYKLEPNEAAIVLGTAMRYDIAEVVDPLVHIVAKIPKSALANIK